jgi:hypothetical protein
MLEKKDLLTPIEVAPDWFIRQGLILRSGFSRRLEGTCAGLTYT